jgi:hypothetical protein
MVTVSIFLHFPKENRACLAADLSAAALAKAEALA